MLAEIVGLTTFVARIRYANKTRSSVPSMGGLAVAVRWTANKVVIRVVQIDSRNRILLESAENRVESIPFYGIDISSQDSSICVKYQERRFVFSKNA